MYNKSVYDKFGREIYSEDGINSRQASSHFEYYRNGFIHKELYQSEYPPEKWECSYVYNSQGQVKEEVSIDKEGKSISAYQYSYDKYGNWISRVTYFNDEPFSFEIRNLKYK